MSSDGTNGGVTINLSPSLQVANHCFWMIDVRIYTEVVQMPNAYIGHFLA